MLLSSGQRALEDLIGKYKILPEMEYDTFYKCFNTYVCPILDYGAEVTGYSKNVKMENLQLKAIRVFLGINKFATKLFLIGDMGWYPCKRRHKLILLRYWNHLIKMDNNRQTKHIFYVDYDTLGFWCSKIYDILKEINSEHVLQNKEICNLQLCKEKLYALYEDS